MDLILGCLIHLEFNEENGKSVGVIDAMSLKHVRII